MEGAVLRRVGIEDMAKVLTIGRAIYGGSDYLPVMYPMYCHSPNYYMYVVEIQEEPVAFVNYNVINDGNDIVVIALRVREDYQGRGLVETIKEFGRNDVRRQVPSVQREVYSTVKNESLTGRIEREPDLHSVPFNWRLFWYPNVQLSRIHEAMHNAKRHRKGPLSTLSPEDCDSLFQSQQARCLLGNNSGWFVCGGTWSPFETTIANLRMISRFVDVRVTFEGLDKSPDRNGNPKAISFEHSCAISEGFRSDLFFYGQEIDDLVHHLESFLLHISMAEPENKRTEVFLKIHFPLVIDAVAVEKFLQEELGERNTSISDECTLICLKLK